jgi:hypothetical protein
MPLTRKLGPRADGRDDRQLSLRLQRLEVELFAGNRARDHYGASTISRLGGEKCYRPREDRARDVVTQLVLRNGAGAVDHKRPGLSAHD